MSSSIEFNRPSDIILIKSEIPTIIERIDYATSNNFTGAPVPGYLSPKAYLSMDAIKSLKEVSKHLESIGLALVVFDAYRPNKSVEYLNNDWPYQIENQSLKKTYYPGKSKKQIINEGFIAKTSSHSRGSTIDLSMARIKDHSCLNMGTIFDYFDEKSFTNSKEIPIRAQKNRDLLKSCMEDCGYINYEKEWWHFRFVEEPYPNTIFDFDIF